MLKLHDGMKLYHGSYCEVSSPNLAKCAVFKDFGKGFYLTSSKEQAESFINIALKKAKTNIFQDLVHEMKRYDVVAGKIADDATNFIITTYMAGAYGKIGSKEADSLCISMLLPERLKDQYCFRTDKALKCLTFIESEQVWKK